MASNLLAVGLQGKVARESGREAEMTSSVSPRVAIRNILVLTDFSPASDEALRCAAAWARGFGAAVHVVHFLRPSTLMLAGDAYVDLSAQAQEEGRVKLAKIAASPELEGIAHATEMDYGEILDDLPAIVTRNHVDLIVLASAGRRGLNKMLLGSTAEKVFRTVRQPVLMLGPGVTTPPSAEPRTILFATDFGEAAEHASSYAFYLAQWTQARLVLLHVMPAAGAHAPGLSDVNLAEGRLRALIPPGAESWCQVEVAVRSGKPAEQIREATRLYAPDLIVLGARRGPKVSLYTGWATAYDLMSESPCPVLTVR